MEYKIVAANAAIGQISVAYLDAAGAVTAIYAIDVPIVDGSFITGDVLEEAIQARAPVWLLERTAAVNNADNFSVLAGLIDTAFVESIKLPTLITPDPLEVEVSLI